MGSSDQGHQGKLYIKQGSRFSANRSIYCVEFWEIKSESLNFTFIYLKQTFRLIITKLFMVQMIFTLFSSNLGCLIIFTVLMWHLTGVPTVKTSSTDCTVKTDPLSVRLHPWNLAFHSFSVLLDFLVLFP